MCPRKADFTHDFPWSKHLLLALHCTAKRSGMTLSNSTEFTWPYIFTFRNLNILTISVLYRGDRRWAIFYRLRGFWTPPETNIARCYFHYDIFFYYTSIILLNLFVLHFLQFTQFKIEPNVFYCKPNSLSQFLQYTDDIQMVVKARIICITYFGVPRLRCRRDGAPALFAVNLRRIIFFCKRC